MNRERPNADPDNNIDEVPGKTDRYPCRSVPVNEVVPIVSGIDEFIRSCTENLVNKGIKPGAIRYEINICVEYYLNGKPKQKCKEINLGAIGSKGYPVRISPTPNNAADPRIDIDLPGAGPRKIEVIEELIKDRSGLVPPGAINPEIFFYGKCGRVVGDSGRKLPFPAIPINNKKPIVLTPNIIEELKKSFPIFFN